ncbi:hypothetical protein BDV96DRAFT_236254 [Lophiotrema nucula]|uniref:Uncharacterized protein n=1 Tax=Lophiotrema nucula TaxID=690887 RepID=A0A6A5YQM1_9PLEO|nr:hypothetical protein BDV96DRAFT_236254 [Lophiotrema nucula]
MANNTDQQRAYNEYMNAVTHNGRQYYQPVGYGQAGGIQQPQPNPYQPQQPNPYQQPSAFGANGVPFPQSHAQYGSGNYASLSNEQMRNLSGPATVPAAGVPPAAPMPPTAAATPGATLNRPGFGIPPPSQALGQQQGQPAAFGGFPHGPLQSFPMHGQPGGFQASGVQYSNPGQMMGPPGMAAGGPPPPLHAGLGSPPPLGNAQREATPWKTSQTYYVDEYELDARRSRRARPSPPFPDLPDENLPPPGPMLLPHTCSECGRMRSAAFHRQHPVAPGEPTILAICGRCRKKGRGGERCVKEYTHVRKCVAEEPCDWPDRMEPPMLPLERGGERRGRLRSRSTSSEEYMEVRRSESRNRMGLRVLQDHDSPPRFMRRRSQSVVRVTSLSPHRPRRETLTEARYYRRTASQSPPYRERRVRTPSPAPVMVHIARNPSPIRSSIHRPMSPSMIHDDMPRGFRRDFDRRIVSHPMPFRPVERDSPPRGILKDTELMHETAHRRRMKDRRSQESTMVDVGGPRVQFVPDRSENVSRASSEREHWHNRVRRFADDGVHAGGDELDELYRRRYHRGERAARSPSPPFHRLQELRIRHEERSPSPPARRIEEVRVRHVSPPPRGRAIQRSDTPYPRPLSLERRESIYRGTSHVRAHIEESPTPSPPRRQIRQLREKEWEELTTTDRTESDGSGGVVSVRRYRKLGDNGRPETWEEVRRTHFIDGDRERERERERVHVHAGSFRDI